jgi:formylglycine-generating enzyme required for sulfatase activity
MRHLGTAALAALLLCPFVAPAAEGPAGISPTQPAAGPFVKVDQGYMVPYTMTIPGSEVTYEMIPIPGGKFKMGSPASEENRGDNEGPQFEVTVKPFWMSKYELTWGEYKQYMAMYGVFKEFEAKKIRPLTDDTKIDAITAPTELYDPSFTYEFGEEPRLPAVTMTQYSARQYTKWLSGITGHFYRLPSEAEWEYACRAGTDTAYSFGDDPADLDDHGWYYDNSDDVPHEVGQKKPNPFGLYDMHGNVAEWVLDELLDDGYAKFKGGSVTAEDALVWPTKLIPRVIKGGSWEDDAEACRSAARLGSEEEDWKQGDPNLPLSPWWFTDDPTRGIGFRIMRPLDVPATKEAKERYWAADVAEINEGVDNRMQDGRGAMGVTDRELPAAIQKMREGS